MNVFFEIIKSFCALQAIKSVYSQSYSLQE